jgi:hypothetical protein
VAVQVERLEAPRPEVPGESLDLGDLGLGLGERAQVGVHLGGDHVGHHLAATMADAARRLGGRERVRQRAADVVPCEEPGNADHRRVGDLDAAEPVLAAEGDALAEARVGGNHAASDVIGVAEAAQGGRLGFGGARPAGDL